MLTCEYLNRDSSPTSKPHSNFLLATFKLLSSYTGGGTKCWPALGPRLSTTGIKKNHWVRALVPIFRAA